MHTLDLVDAASLRADLPDFRPGDTLKVHVRVVEGNKSRVQVFQGVVIRRQGAGVRETFTVRKVSFGVGVERTFPVHTPVIEKIEVVTRGDVRRAKLYYLRDLRGKKARSRRSARPRTRAAGVRRAAGRTALSAVTYPHPRWTTTPLPACRWTSRASDDDRERSARRDGVGGRSRPSEPPRKAATREEAGAAGIHLARAADPDRRRGGARDPAEDVPAAGVLHPVRARWRTRCRSATA